jgi:ABC-type transport system substrate-binding protein
MITGISWEQAEQLLKTNPKLQSFIYQGVAMGLKPRVDVEPLSDIRVRKAINMAIDRELIAETIYGGYVEGKPVGEFGPQLRPYYTPFEEWPEDLQEEYTYNPEKAKQLLAEAGYPNGFKTSCVVSGSASDECLAFKDMLLKIGIDMEIQILDDAAFFSYVNFYHKHDQMSWYRVASYDCDPDPVVRQPTTGYFQNSWMLSDPVYDDMAFFSRIDKEGNSRPLDEIVRITKECNMYILGHHWVVPSVPSLSFYLWQSWFKGYSGEVPSAFWSGNLYARLWIDKESKESMGY